MKKILILLPILLIALAACGTTDDVNFTVPTKMSVEVGGTKQIEVTIISGDIESDEISYYSDDNDSVTVNSNGIVSGIVQGGNATVTVRAGNSSKEIEVNVVAENEAVTGIDVPASIAVILGSSASVRAFVKPTTALNQDISYTSGNTSIATVDPTTGIVSSVAEGQTNIVSTTVDGGYVGNTIVYVARYVDPVTGITAPSYIGVRRGSTAQITYTITPSTAPAPTITYVSDNQNIATVSTSGLVTGVAVGKANITLSTGGGLISTTVQIDVYQP